jgi:hypothetical protein
MTTQNKLQIKKLLLSSIYGAKPHITPKKKLGFEVSHLLTAE